MTNIPDSSAYRAVIEYDGSNYFGFQRQKEGVGTIQSELEEALTGLAGSPVRVAGAGRTDTGVHALGQVVGFTIDWPSRHGTAALQRALNANLPRDIVVRWLDEAAADFHPRFDARSRTYEYRVHAATTRRPLTRLRAWQIASVLDVNEMNAAAALLLGEQDFAAFGRAPTGDNTVRHVFEAYWRRDGEFFNFRVTANAFLNRMVRRLVGSLKEVGTGFWSVKRFAEALESRDRSRSAAAAPAQGLYLVSVAYNE